MGSGYNESVNQKWVPLLLAMVLLVAMGFFSRDFGLVYDSRALLTRHPVITGVAGPGEAFSRPYLDRLGDGRGLKTYYRPLAVLSFSLGRLLWERSPGAERIVNLLLFFAWLWLVYGIVHRREKDRWMAGVVMLLCACYPLNWDNVSWVAGRPDMLMLVFGTAALLMLEGEDRRYRLAQGGAVLFFGLALLSKETAFFFLPLLVLPMGRRREPGRVTRGLFVLLSLATLVARHAVTGFWGAPGSGRLSLFRDAARLFGALGVYARSLIFPFGVSPYLPPEWVPGTLDILLGGAMAGVMGWLVYRWFLYREERLPLSLLLVFIGGHLLAVFSALSLNVAPRFLTIPFFGAAWWVMRKAGKYSRILRPVAIALLLMFTPFVFLQASAYRDNLTYWQRIHAVYPESVHFSLQLAREYVAGGRFLQAETLLLSQKPNTDRARGDRSLLLANVDLARADYDSLDRHLALAAGSSDAAAVASGRRLKARMFLLRGKEEEAFTMMAALIRDDPRAEWVGEYQRMLLGRCHWRRAMKLQNSFYHRGINFSRDAEEVAVRFSRMSPQERLRFFNRNWNPQGALALLSQLPESPRNSLSRAGMLYFAGKPEAAERLLASLTGLPGMEKTVGIWYWRRMVRPREALWWLRQSLERDPEQPDVVRMLEELESREDAGISRRGER